MMIGPVTVSTSASVPALNNNSTSLNYRGPYGPAETTWSFPVVLADDQWMAIYSIHFSDKYLQPGPGVVYPPANTVLDPSAWPLAGQPWRGRSNAVIIDSVDTIHSHEANRVYGVPLRLPPGFTLTGRFSNNSTETQNMIVIITGWMYDGDPNTLPRFHP